MAKRIPLCEMCNDRFAEYVCSNCGNLVCRYDFDPYLRVCKDCIPKYDEARVGVVEDYDPIKWFIVVFLGFILISIGFVLMSLSAWAGSGEAFIVVAPFPFVFFGKTGVEAALIILIIFILLFLFLLRYFRFSSPRGPS